MGTPACWDNPGSDIWGKWIDWGELFFSLLCQNCASILMSVCGHLNTNELGVKGLNPCLGKPRRKVVVMARLAAAGEFPPHPTAVYTRGMDVHQTEKIWPY